MLLNTHDDLPHPVPPMAYLRYKENYFWLGFCPDQDVWLMSHLNFEPGFDRARFSCNLMIRGKLYKYGNQIPFPKDFAHSKVLTDGSFSLTFVEPHKRYDLKLDSDLLKVDITFTGRQSTYDYGASRTAAPDMPSFAEAMTLALNLPYNHHQQGLNTTGTVTIQETGETITLDGSGYRDHSWVMRADSLSKSHFWCGFNFPSMTVGCKTLDTTHRPGLTAKEGYVSDKDGPRALVAIEVEPQGVGQGPSGLPTKVIHKLKDVFGQTITIESDIANRLAHVPLVSEAPGSGDTYFIVENFVRCRHVESGEEGIALVEIGRNSRDGHGAYD